MIPAIIILLAGIIVTYMGRRDLLLAWQSRKWPCVQGFIADKIFRQGKCFSLSRDGTFSPKTRPWKEMDLLYKYHVNGREYSSTRFDFAIYGLAHNTHYYEDGENVKVYYCPENPAVSVLKPGLRADLVFGPLLIITAFIVPFLWP